MKKIVILLLLLSASISSFAQFEKGKYYAATALTGLDLNYSGFKKFNIGFDIKAGYFIIDELMLLADLGWDHQGGKDNPDYGTFGVGGRYYIIQNGLYLGVNIKYLHADHDYNDILPGLEVGYAFFLSRTVTVEPAIYYDQSFRKHSDYSKIGLRIGFGFYL